MKKKAYIVLVTMIIALSINACGKKTNSVSDNLISENPDQINFDDITIPEGVSENVVANIEQMAQSYGSNNVSEANGEEASEEINEQEDNQPADDVSTAMEALSEEDEEAEALPLDSEESPIQNNTEVADSITLNSTLNIANLSGINLKKLCITFNTGTLVDNDILQGQKLKDGDTFEFIVLDLDSLRSTTDLILTVTGYDKSDNKIEFGDIRIIDPANMNIILSYDSNGYTMYIE